MRFEDALQQRTAPERLGDLRLHYDAPVLIGEAVRGSRYAPETFFTAALASGIGAVGALVANPGGAIAVPLVLAILAAALIGLAVRTERAVRRPRRFALHFLDETLRVELPGWRARSAVVPFDDVRDVYVLERADQRYSLAIDFDLGGARRTVLIAENVTAGESEALRRFWTLLRAAFGLTPKEA